MTRRRLIGFVLCLLVLLTCTGPILIFTASKLMNTTPSNLFVRILAVTYILKETLSQPPVAPPSELFRKYVLDPIPASATEIRADRHIQIWNYGYTLKFDINKSDLALIINSRPFQRVSYVSYSRQTGLWFRWDRHRSERLLVYGHGTHKPAWFTLEQWKDPEAYLYAFTNEPGSDPNIEAYAFDNKRGSDPNIQVLVYNVQLGQAYFVVEGRD